MSASAATAMSLDVVDELEGASPNVRSPSLHVNQTLNSYFKGGTGSLNLYCEHMHTATINLSAHADIYICTFMQTSVKLAVSTFL